MQNRKIYNFQAKNLNTGGTINLDATDFLCIDGNQIYLGAKARAATQSTKQPVLLGNKTKEFLKLLLDELQGLAIDLATSTDPILIARGAQMQKQLPLLFNRINPNGPSELKSKKVYTE